MRKLIIYGLLYCLIAAAPHTTLQAQTEDLVAYVPRAHVTGTAPEVTRENSSYKDYVGVYVRAKVMRSFLDAFEDATQVHWYLGNNEYLASFKRAGRTCKALFNINGELLYFIRYGTEKNLPRDVAKLVRFTYPDYNIGAIAEVDERGTTRWIINLHDAARLIVVQVLDGAVDELHYYKTHF